jgi:hypothetical protein
MSPVSTQPSTSRRAVRVGGREGRQPLLVPLVPDHHVVQVRQVGGEAGHLGALVPGRDQDAALRVAEHVRVRLGAVALVQRHPDEVADRGAEEEVGRGQAVVLQHRHPVARLGPEGGQRAGEPQAALPGLAVGQPVGAADDRDAVGVELRGPAQRGPDIEHARLPARGSLIGVGFG